MKKLPSHKDLYWDILNLLKDGGIFQRKNLILPLAKKLKLPEVLLIQKFEDRNETIFSSRIKWSLTYLALSGLLDRPKRGYFKISQQGLALVYKSQAEIFAIVNQKMAEREEVRKLATQNNTKLQENMTFTAEEQLYLAYQAIRQNSYEEILDTVLSKTPQAFEHLVVQLLQKMGYGEWGSVTQISRDAGIDGEIKEDVLGFGKILIQAKRLKKDQTIGRPDIQKFAGAILGQSSNANKGVFITTARFSQDAIEYVQHLPNAKIVLIDGLKLAEYIYHYELGMQIEQTFKLKKLDADFWDNIDNDE